MNRLHLALGLFVIASLLTGCSHTAPQGPEKLRCEYLKDPIGIDTASPRLGWIDLGDHPGQTQSAYQVVVTSGKEVLWDSGKVAGGANGQIGYAGRLLRSGEQAQWRVRTWDEKDLASAWSAPAWWEAGKCDQAWTAKWIAGERGNAAPMLRKEFALGGNVRRARAYVSGVGYFELHVNGKVVSNRLDPGLTDFDKRVLYCTMDVTDELRAGNNAIGMILGTGWFDVHQVNVWNWQNAPWRGIPRGIVELRVDMEDGTTQTIVSDASWKYSTGPWTNDNIYGGADYDARLEKTGWDSAGYDDGQWKNANVVNAPKGRLVARQMPAVRVVQEFTPVKIAQPKEGVYLVDLGQNMAGVPELYVTGPAGTRVSLKCGERLGKDGLLDQSQIDMHVRRFSKDEPFQEDHYTLKGGGEEIWSPRFTYHGFQYVEVSGFPGKLTKDNIRGLAFHTDVPEAGEFECSNALLNKIQSANRWSFVNNLETIETDCPTREKNGWTGDANLAAESAMLNYDPAAFYTKWVNDISDAQREDGNLPGIVPSPGWGYGKDIGPAWDSICILLPWQVYEYYGDTRILAEHYATMQKYMDYLQRLQKGWLIESGLGDWAPYEAKTSNVLTSSGYFYHDAVVMSQIAKLLGKADDARKYEEQATAIRAVINARFFDAEKNSYAEGSQTALSCALYQGFAQEEHREAIFANLVALIEKDHRHLDCGILGAKYVMNELIDHGREDLVYAIMAKEDMPSWGYWIDHGATTLWESWKDVDSRNHVMFGDVSACMIKALAGVRRDAPGFAHISIRPTVVEDYGKAGPLLSARAAYHSVHGEIVSDWKVENQTFNLDVTIPVGVTASVYVPTLFSETALETSGIHPARHEGGSTVFEVGSGQYHFEAVYLAHLVNSSAAGDHSAEK